MSSKVDKPVFANVREPWRDPLPTGSYTPQGVPTPGHPQQKDTLKSSSSSESGSCFSDCLAGLWRFLAWLFSCCGGSVSEAEAATEEGDDAKIEDRKITLWVRNRSGHESISVSLNQFVRFSSIKAEQERWHHTTVKVDTVVVLALQIRGEKGERTRWVMQTGVRAGAQKHLRNALTGFYSWIEQQDPSAPQRKVEFTFARFERNAKSSMFSIGEYDCHLDSQIGDKVSGIVQRQELLSNVAIELSDGKKLPKELKQNTLLQNRALLTSIIRFDQSASQRHRAEVWELNLCNRSDEGSLKSPDVIVQKFTEKDLRK